MHRIDTAYALPGGYFTEGDPMTPVPATEVSAAWLNTVQGELEAVIVGAGIALEKTDNAQLLAALVAMGVRAATTERTGVVELATNAEGAALTDATRPITPSVLGSMVTRSLANVGYQRFPGGLIVQWGHVASVPGGGSATVTLSITFPTAIVLALATPHVSAGTESGQSMSAHCLSTSQISLANTGSLGTNCPAYWLAIGY